MFRFRFALCDAGLPGILIEIVIGSGYRGVDPDFAMRSSRLFLITKAVIG
jgi:hypothetical protein